MTIFISYAYFLDHTVCKKMQILGTLMQIISYTVKLSNIKA